MIAGLANIGATNQDPPVIEVVLPNASTAKEVEANPGCPGLFIAQLPTILNILECYKPLVPKNVTRDKNIAALRGRSGHDAVKTDTW